MCFAIECEVTEGVARSECVGKKDGCKGEKLEMRECANEHDNGVLHSCVSALMSQLAVGTKRESVIRRSACFPMSLRTACANSGRLSKICRSCKSVTDPARQYESFCVISGANFQVRTSMEGEKIL